MAKSVSADYYYTITPGTKFDPQKIGSSQPYTGDLFVEQRGEINYGITNAVSIESILQFIDINRLRILEAGMRPQNFSANCPFSGGKDHLSQLPSKIAFSFRQSLRFQGWWLAGSSDSSPISLLMVKQWQPQHQLEAAMRKIAETVERQTTSGSPPERFTNSFFSLRLPSFPLSSERQIPSRFCQIEIFSVLRKSRPLGKVSPSKTSDKYLIQDDSEKGGHRAYQRRKIWDQ